MAAKTIAEIQYDKMINRPIPKIITQLAVPTVCSMLVTALYNIADTYFVSHINTQASAAVGIVFPVMSIIQACGFTLGMGSGSLVSRYLGEKRNDEANEIASTGFFTALGFGLVITILGTLFSSVFMKLVGASDSVLPYANAYARYIFFGAPLMCASFVLNNVLRSEGKSFFSMIALTSGGVINIALDPLFIYVFKLGISGAAIATLISQCISFFILLSWFLRRKAICRMSISLCTKKLSVLVLIVATGIPSLARQGLASFATILLNRAAGNYGDAAVAGMTIVTKLVMFLASVMIGIGQGFTPVAGYNYGAGRYDRVKEAYRFTVAAGFTLLAVLSGIGFIFARQIMERFIEDSEAIRIGTNAFRWQVAVLPLHPLIVCTNMIMQSTGHIKAATFLSCNRQGVYFIPAILILPMLLGLTGVEVSQAAADFLSVITAIPYIIWFFRKLDKKTA